MNQKTMEHIIEYNNKMNLIRKKNEKEHYALQDTRCPSAIISAINMIIHFKTIINAFI